MFARRSYVTLFFICTCFWSSDGSSCFLAQRPFYSHPAYGRLSYTSRPLFLWLFREGRRGKKNKVGDKKAQKTTLTKERWPQEHTPTTTTSTRRSDGLLENTPFPPTRPFELSPLLSLSLSLSLPTLPEENKKKIRWTQWWRYRLDSRILGNTCQQQ